MAEWFLKIEYFGKKLGCIQVLAFLNVLIELHLIVQNKNRLFN